MSESLLNDLELQIDQLIVSLEQLRLENQSLRKKIVNISKENTVLLDKKTKAATAIKELITGLQDELLCQTQK
ncbi:MAG: TIGR02449 family protein [Coxiellaceae bacterium]|jgi:cell division protein ZapB|nr:TIGR02449 family protein [Coxiellaceae bacterium]